MEFAKFEEIYSNEESGELIWGSRLEGMSLSGKKLSVSKGAIFTLEAALNETQIIFKSKDGYDKTIQELNDTMR